MQTSVLRPPKFSGGSLLPPVVDDDGRGGSGWVELTRAPNEIEAMLLTGRLNHAGVESTTVKDRSRHIAWLLGSADQWAPVTVMVRRFQLTDAQIVLAEIAYDLPDAPQEATVRGPSGWRDSALWWGVAVALGLLLTGLALAKTADDIQRCVSSGNCRFIGTERD